MRKEITINGTINTTPLTTIDFAVDTTDMNFGSPPAGESSDPVQKTLDITGEGTINIKIGSTDWISVDSSKIMPGGTTSVAVDSGAYVPVVVAEEVSLGNFVQGTYTLSFIVTPPIDIDLNTYTQKIVVIGEY